MSEFVEVPSADDELDTAFEGASEEHYSGEPLRRNLVLGDNDPSDQNLHEHITSENRVWDGRIFSVDRLKVALADGREAIRDVVRNSGAVAIVALTADGRICLVRQYRTALDRVTVEIPAGKLEPGEDPPGLCAPRAIRRDRHGA